LPATSLRERGLRAALAAPRVFFAVGEGRLLGHRFLELTHRGRRTGRPYAVVLEVLAWDGREREAIVVSGLGPRANWLRNVLAAGTAEVRIGGERFPARVRKLGLAEGAAVLADYERRNRLLRPVVRRVLARLAGCDYDGSEAARRAIVERLPFVALRATTG
jgi:deazaflavin-dependent oxidoreductase (nitroreductase family)